MLAWFLPSDLRPPPEYVAQDRAGYGMPELEPEPQPRQPTRLGFELAPNRPHEHHYELARSGLRCCQCLIPYNVIRRHLASKER
jgi:hypothetical protein